MNKAQTSVNRGLAISATALLLAFIVGYECSARSPRSSPNTISPPATKTQGIQGTGTSTNVHLTLGNPSWATTNTTNPNNYLMTKSQYALAYNNSKGTPNWVSWQLNRYWLGDTSRQNDFRPDDKLPSNWYHVKPTDYSYTGYDKGHMAPSADRTKTLKDNSATFFMTNMIPQAPDNNQGPWVDLEEYCRELVNQQGKELYIIAGPDGKLLTIANGKVTVPAKTWKIIVILDKPGLGVAGVTKNTRVIAVEMPNSQGIRNNNWKKYRTSVRKLEFNTNYNFLSNVPTSIQNMIENRVDNQ